MSETVDIVFDGPPSHDAPRFVEVERNQRSIRYGEWVELHSGLWALRIPDGERLQSENDRLRNDITLRDGVIRDLEEKRVELNAEIGRRDDQITALQAKVHLCAGYDTLEALARRLWIQIHGDDELFEDALRATEDSRGICPYFDSPCICESPTRDKMCARLADEEDTAALTEPKPGEAVPTGPGVETEWPESVKDTATPTLPPGYDKMKKALERIKNMPHLRGATGDAEKGYAEALQDFEDALRQEEIEDSRHPNDACDAEIERIMAMSGPEICAELRRLGQDPDEVVERVGLIIRNAIDAVTKQPGT